MMTPTEIINVIKAHEEGKEIEVWNGQAWCDCVCPLWNFAKFTYRVEQKEKTLYQFLLKNKIDDRIISSSQFYPDKKKKQKDYLLSNYTVIKKLHHTKIIIKE